MPHTTVRQALQRVADYPHMLDDDLLQMPAHELVARALYDIANNPDASVRGSLSRANKARKIILDRMVGRRRAGTHPATHSQAPVELLDLTVVPIPTGETDDERDRAGEEVPSSDPGGTPGEPGHEDRLALEPAVRDDSDDLEQQP